ncbi:MAG: hypothetical protein LBI17_03575 [Rickettsiales bacterium]|nr:hypothetical protein [Rickettsiales bacterium]
MKVKSLNNIKAWIEDKIAKKSWNVDNMELLASIFGKNPLRRYFFRLNLRVAEVERGARIVIPHIAVSPEKNYSVALNALENACMDDIPHAIDAMAVVEAWQEYDDSMSFIHRITHMSRHSAGGHDFLDSSAGGHAFLNNFPDTVIGRSLRKSYESYIRKDAEMVEIRIALANSPVGDTVVMPVRDIARFTDLRSPSVAAKLPAAILSRQKEDSQSM